MISPSWTRVLPVILAMALAPGVSAANVPESQLGAEAGTTSRYQSADDVCDALNSEGQARGCAGRVDRVFESLCPVMADSIGRGDLRQVVTSPGTFVLSERAEPPTPGCTRPTTLTRGSGNATTPRDVLRNASDPRRTLPEWVMPERLQLDDCLPRAVERLQLDDRLDACRVRVLLAFEHMSEVLAATRTRAARNVVLRAVSNAWGAPSSVAALVHLFGCDASNSYDEFLSCTIVLERMLLDVNVYFRLDETDGSAWKCSTCGLHRHSGWWASRTVAGAIVHTIAQPTCPRAKASWPLFDELDSMLEDAGADGTRVDINGSQYVLKAAVWQTTDLVRVGAGQSLVFSPTWFHRIIPPPKDATHWAVTFRVADTVKMSGAQLWPPALSIRYSNHSVCFTRHDLVRALLHPDLATFEGVQLGMPAIECTIDPMPLPRTSQDAVRREGWPTAPPFVTASGATAQWSLTNDVLGNDEAEQKIELPWMQRRLQQVLLVLKLLLLLLLPALGAACLYGLCRFLAFGTRWSYFRRRIARRLSGAAAKERE